MHCCNINKSRRGGFFFGSPGISVSVCDSGSKIPMFLSCIDAYLCHDMSVLFTCLRHVRAAMEGEASYYFDQDLYCTADPLELAVRNVTLILSDPRFLCSYHDNLFQI